MCGISGVFDFRDGRPISRALVQAMNDSLAHRGPDGGGVHVEPGVGLGHRRLAIIDLAAGAQPMHSADGDLVLVYNGEIYNYPALRRELEGRGHRFLTHCDTEVILHAWQAWGEAGVERLNGMFAFALWQRSTGTLFLARDRIGIKPLYYGVLDDGRLLFGSELKALLAHPDLRRELDPTAVEDFFAFGYVPDPKTILRGVHKLAPGHTLRVRRGDREPRARRYWDLAFEAEPECEPAILQAELIERLRTAVGSELMADVPLGAFLSGGVDSSAVVAMMAGEAAEPVTTCAIGFGDRRFDESRFADQVAQRYRTRHQTEQVDPDAFDLVDRLATVYDEPYADSSAMPTYRVCALARKHVKVALSGDGGDENFAGYRRHRLSFNEARVRGWLPQSARGPLFGALGRWYPKLDWAPRPMRAKSTFQALAMDTVDGYYHAVSVTTDAQRRRLFSADLERSLEGHRAVEVFREHARQANATHPLSLVQYLDFKTYLPGDILTKVDRASMAHGLEVRVPILNHEFVEWAARVPPACKLHRGEGKYVFKKALEPHLPHDVLYRPKMGFSVPLAKWFRGPLAEPLRAALLDSGLAGSDLFERRELTRLVEQHQRGAANYAPMLWALLMFERFQQQVLQGQPAARAVA